MAGSPTPGWLGEAINVEGHQVARAARAGSGGARCHQGCEENFGPREVRAVNAHRAIQIRAVAVNLLPDVIDDGGVGTLKIEDFVPLATGIEDRVARRHQDIERFSRAGDARQYHVVVNDKFPQFQTKLETLMLFRIESSCAATILLISRALFRSAPAGVPDPSP